MTTTNDPQAPYSKPTERTPKEAIGPSGLTAKRISELIIATGLKDQPLFTDREVVRRVIDGLITSGDLITKAEHERLMEEEYQRGAGDERMESDSY